MKQTVCKVLKIFQYGKYLVAYVLKTLNLALDGIISSKHVAGTHKKHLGRKSGITPSQGCYD